MAGEVRNVQFAEGVEVTAPVQSFLTASNLPNYIDDAAYVSAKGQAAARGDIYVRNSDDVIRYYGDAWFTIAELTKVQVITNKGIDGGTATDARYIKLPSGDTASLDLLTDVAGLIAYDTSLQTAVINTGSGWTSIGGTTIERILQPTNTSPGNGSTNISNNPTLTASTYANIYSPFTHAESDWQVTTVADTSFSSPVFESLADGSNLTTIVVSTTLTPGTEYRWRVRYTDSENFDSSYSDSTTFTTILQFVDTPSITFPTGGATGIDFETNFTTSAFSTTGGAQTHNSSRWQVDASAGDFSSPVYDSGNDAVNLESINLSSADFTESTTYKVRALHTGSVTGDSNYSTANTFTTAASFEITVREYTDGSVGNVGGTTQTFAGHTMEVVEPGITAPEVLALYNFESGALTTDTAGNHPLTDTGSIGQAGGIFGGSTSAASPTNGVIQHYTANTLLDTTPTNAYTIDCWLKPGGLGGTSTVFQKTMDASNEISLWQNGPGTVFYLQVTVAGTTKTVNSGTIAIGTWYHIVASYDTTNGLRIWTDGTLSNTDGTLTSTLTGTSTNNITLFNGGGTKFPSFTYDGDCAYMRFTDKLVTQSFVDMAYSTKYDWPGTISFLPTDAVFTLNKKVGGSDPAVPVTWSTVEAGLSSTAFYRKGGVFGTTDTHEITVKDS